MTFGLAGLWHGANWTFVFWGFWHGLALGICRLWQATKIGKVLKVPAVLGWSLTMLVVGIGWLFFRATSFHQITAMLGSLGHMSGPEWTGIYARAVLLGIGVMFLVDIFQRRLPWERVCIWPLGVRAAIQGVLLVFIITRWGKEASPFIYFQF